MGFLKNILSDAIGDGISKAVGKAVEKTVAPAAERFAQKQAQALDNASQNIENSINAAQAELVNAADAVSESAASATTEINAAASAELSASAEGASPAQRQLTPEEKAQAAEAAQALKGLGGIFSGALAMAKKEMEAEKANKLADEAAIFDNWAENLGAYPKWDIGGEDFVLEEMTPRNGHPAFCLNLTGRPFLVEMYAAKLRSDGFVAMGTKPDDLNADTYYKMINGVCHAFNRTDASNGGRISVSFYVDDYVPKPQQQQASAPADELKNLAKGIFKKLF